MRMRNLFKTRKKELDEAKSSYLSWWRQSAGTIESGVWGGLASYGLKVESEEQVRARLESLTIEEINLLTGTLTWLKYPSKMVLRRLLALHANPSANRLASADGAYRMMARAFSEDAAVGPLVGIEKLAIWNYLHLKERVGFYHGDPAPWQRMEVLTLSDVPTDVIGGMCDDFERQIDCGLSGEDLKTFIVDMEKPWFQK